jgi:hypothetical protein
MRIETAKALLPPMRFWHALWIFILHTVLQEQKARTVIGVLSTVRDEVLASLAVAIALHGNVLLLSL